MGFRNIIINERCKLEYSMNYLICRRGIEEKRVLLDEIKLLLIDSTQVAITTALLAMLSRNKIKVIFCDEFHNPDCELVSYQNNFYSYRKIKEQIEFVKNQGFLWKRIVEEKIKNQAKNLQFLQLLDSYNMLISYSKNVEINDVTNREGHSAKVYFNSLFGKDFSRGNSSIINKFLNYGYAILLSAFNREIKSLGYLTEVGIHHIGESNPFNLSCDLIEPFRPYVDSLIIKGIVNEENYKIEFVRLLSSAVYYNGKNILLENCIHLYVINMFDYMKNKESLIFPQYEL